MAHRQARAQRLRHQKVDGQQRSSLAALFSVAVVVVVAVSVVLFILFAHRHASTNTNTITSSVDVVVVVVPVVATLQATKGCKDRPEQQMDRLVQS